MHSQTILSLLLVVLALVACARALNCELYGLEGQCREQGQACCWGAHVCSQAETCQNGIKFLCGTCRPLKSAHKEALQTLYTAWGYPRTPGATDGNVDLIVCPHQGSVADSRVNCDDEGQINDLLLGNDELYGQLDPFCTAFDKPGIKEHLHVMSFAANRLYGTVPACINSFTNVYALFLQNNYFRGVFPQISSLVKLETCQIVNKVEFESLWGLDENCFDCLTGDGLDPQLAPQACQDDEKYWNRCMYHKNMMVTEISCPPMVIPPTYTSPATTTPSSDKCYLPVPDMDTECPCGQMGCECTRERCNEGLSCDKDTKYCILASSATTVRAFASFVSLGVTLLVSCLLM